jgi:diguanylate cyclase (GGDEF)-like protein
MDQSIVVSAVVCSLCFLMAIAMLPLAGRESPSRAAILYGTGFLLMGGSVLSYVLGPAFMSGTAEILLRNALVLAGFATLWASPWIRCARPLPVLLMAMILSPWLAAFGLYLVLSDRPLLRFGFAAVSIALGCLASAWCLVRYKLPRNVGDIGTVAVLAFGAAGEAWIACGALLLGFDQQTLLGVYGVVAPVLFVGLGIFVFQSYALDAMEELNRRAQTDPLTGLLNRRAFDERLARALAAAQRYRRPLSVVISDIDHFKDINDTHGHATGDQVLAAFAQLLQAQSRTVDTVARIGGEEFAILMPEVDAAGAAGCAERLRHAVEHMRGPEGIGITASFGLADLIDARHDAASLLALADEALYVSKAGGRNRVSWCARAAAA